MEKRGFKVTRHYLEDRVGFKTAWRAEWSHGQEGRVIGLQSEMDALPRIGHACGHNLIAINGVAVALGLRSALEKHDIPGKIILLGTPGESPAFSLRRPETADLIPPSAAEEHGGGKIKLLEAGAYREMDVCLM